MENLYVIVFAAVLPAFLLVAYIYWKDKYQREPLSQIAKGVFYGVASAAVALVLELLFQVCGLVSEDPANWMQAVWKAFIGAAVPEEAAKLFMLYLLLRHNRYFDERFDGIVYAVCVGMGFAGTENIIYLFSYLGDWQSVAVSRAVFAVPGHFLFAVAMGYFYSMLSFGDMSWRKAGRIFLVPVFLHGVYDSLLFVAGVSNLFVRVLLLLCFYYFCFKMLRYGRARIAEHLTRDRQDVRQVAFWHESDRIFGRRHEDKTPENNTKKK
jgi:RsiW-degrading membrane proteinase PrsW (M82 family)